MKIVCPHCDAPLINTAETVGEVVACPHCRKRLKMPPLDPAAPAVSRKPPVVDKPPVANKPPVAGGSSDSFPPVVNTGMPRIKTQSTSERYRDSRRKALAAGGGFGVFFVIFIILRLLRVVLRSADRTRDRRPRHP